MAQINNINMKIKCLQINLQHSRAATDNLTQIIQTYCIDIVFIQEPYLIHNRVAGISRNYKIYTYGNNKIRAAIIIVNRNIDALLINQLSDDDTVAVELIYNGFRFFAASMYLDITEDIKLDLVKLDKILTFTKGTGLLTAMDSNARSTMWYDVTTNTRGKIMEEYVSANNLYVMNEDSDNTTFESRRGKSNIDLTITNSQLFTRLEQWECSGEESCSDHRYISFSIAQHIAHNTALQFHGTKYIIKRNKLEEFNLTLKRTFSGKLSNRKSTDEAEYIDDKLCTMLKLKMTLES